MKIKQVEELVGITSKNIRFYEEQGLLQPQRTENGYRNYGLEEVETLKKVKLFRKIGMPVEEIHKMLWHEQSMEDCLNRQEEMLDKEREAIEKRRLLTQQMLEASLSVEKLEPDYWLDEIEKMEKEGTAFVNTDKMDIHRKKKLGAGMGAFFMIGIMLFVFGFMIYGYTTDEEFPIYALFLMAIPVVLVIAGTIVAMKDRMSEIDKGEEDEAAKY